MIGNCPYAIFGEEIPVILKSLRQYSENAFKRHGSDPFRECGTLINTATRNALRFSVEQ